MHTERQFCNPVPFTDGRRHTNPDPFVMKWCGRYYCYATDENGVKISVSEDLVNWEYLGYGIQNSDYTNFWAPSVHYENGSFYMYYSTLRKDEDDTHKEWLQLAVSDRPEGPFCWKKTFFEKFSIDSHPILWNEKLYMFYSVNDWIGADEKVAGTIILLDEMKSPEEFSGNPKAVLLPSVEQEIFQKNRFGDGRDWYTLEGAATVVHGGRCYLTYSANAYVNVDYFVGSAVAENRKNLMEMDFRKYPAEDVWCPLLKKNQQVEGTGHNTIVKAPNMIDDWIVYHGRMADEELVPEIEQREMRIDPLYFNGRQMICTGPTQTRQDYPESPNLQCRDRIILDEQMLGETTRFYCAEYWLSAKENHIGCRFDLYLNWYDAANYMKLSVWTGRKEMDIWECRNGLQKRLTVRGLPDQFDYKAPHLFRVICMENSCRVILDDRYTMEAKADCFWEKKSCFVGIRPYFNEMHLHSFALSEFMDLTGDYLMYLNEHYRIANAVVGQSGMLNRQGDLKLVNAMHPGKYTEEFQLFPASKNNKLVARADGHEWVLAENMAEEFSVYCFASGAEIELAVNGDFSEENRIAVKPDYEFSMTNIGVLQYRFSKN